MAFRSLIKLMGTVSFYLLKESRYVILCFPDLIPFLIVSFIPSHILIYVELKSPLSDPGPAQTLHIVRAVCRRKLLSDR